MCYPADQLMHQMSEWFVQQPPSLAGAALRLQRCVERGHGLALRSTTVGFRSTSRTSSHAGTTRDHWWIRSVDLRTGLARMMIFRPAWLCAEYALEACPQPTLGGYPQ